ncbi:MAG TPA: cyclic nucleotide-binding domain-containing protein [Candidatus Limnocylindrales bacterium]|nr:cyclic nucleotide-binding domain-containing protein [Candidatus Limnocylindrales bacterium]
MTVSSDTKLELLRRVELFGGVEPRHLEKIAERVVEVDFEAGRQIVREGDVGTGFYVVVEGSVSVIRDGRTVARLGQGDFFGELSILDHRPRIAQVVADEPTRCLALASWDLEAIMLEEPALTVAILRGVAARLRALTEESRH